MTAPPLFTRQEAANRARVSLVTLNKLIRDGRGPNLTTIGGKSFVSGPELAAWISALTQKRQLQPEGAAA